MGISGWHHITIPVPDIERSEEWYCRVLGGEVFMRTGWDPRDVRAQRNRQIWITTGSALINLAEGAKMERSKDFHFFHYAFTAPPDELDFWIEHLRANDVDVMGPFGHGGVGLLSLYFDDPDDYRLEIVMDFGDYEVAKAEALERGGALGNPTAVYEWV